MFCLRSSTCKTMMGSHVDRDVCDMCYKMKTKKSEVFYVKYSIC
jgi:hypothetical protein